MLIALSLLVRDAMLRMFVTELSDLRVLCVVLWYLLQILIQLQENKRDTFRVIRIFQFEGP